MSVAVILAALATAQAASAGPPLVARPNWEAGVKIEVPREIAPALFPYMQCQADHMNRRAMARMSGEMDSVHARLTGADILRACADLRAEASRRAARMLKAQGGRSRRERTILVAETLARLDAFILDPDAEAAKLRKEAGR